MAISIPTSNPPLSETSSQSHTPCRVMPAMSASVFPPIEIDLVGVINEPVAVVVKMTSSPDVNVIAVTLSFAFVPPVTAQSF